MDLRTLLRLKAAGGGGGEIVELTATGDIATFSTNLARKLKTVEVGITPVQDLHGYDNPWPAGGGKNLANIENVTDATGVTHTISGNSITFTTTVSNTNRAGEILIPSSGLVGKTLTLSGSKTITSVDSAKAMIRAKTGSAYTNLVQSNTGNISFAISAEIPECDYVVVYMGINGANAAIGDTATYSNIQLEIGSSATSYAPYSNICPITGWTGAEVSRTGENVWDEQWELGSISNTTGENQISSTRFRSKNFIGVVSGESYYLKHPAVSLRVVYYKADKTFHSALPTVTSSLAITIPANVCYMRFWQEGTTYNNDISINYPSTDTAYHASHVVTKTYPFPTPPGTVYGGSLTVNKDGTGVLTVDSARVLVSSLSWTYDSNNTRFSSTITDVKQYSSNRVTPYKGECFITVDDGRAIGNVPNFGIYGVANSKSVFVKDTDDSDPAVFTQKYGTTAIVYPLATPVSYNLSNLEVIQALSGTINNVWTNTGGQSTVTYYKKLNS